jgi:hypothetical protein
LEKNIEAHVSLGFSHTWVFKNKETAMKKLSDELEKAKISEKDKEKILKKVNERIK